MAGFTFVGREAAISTFRRLLARPRGELLLVTGPEGLGKSLLLRRLRAEADSPRRHFVQLNNLGGLPDAELRYYAIIAALAAGHQKGQGKDAQAAPAVQLVANPRESFDRLMTDDQRRPHEKLLSVFSAASTHLPDDSRLVLLLDLGRAEGEDAFPLEFLARRLPEKVKLVLAARHVPPALEGLDNATVLAGLPPLAEADLARLLQFHRKGGPADAAVVGAMLDRYHGSAMPTDLAAKLLGEGGPEALASLPADVPGLCQQLVMRLSAEQRRLAECVARVPFGAGIGSLRALLGFSNADLRRLLSSEEIRNLVMIERSARGPEAHLFHELLTDQFLAGKAADASAFHKRAAAFFLDLAQKDGTNVEALSAHAYHVRLCGDRRQFIEDFPKTYKAKHTLRLFRHLADEYELLLDSCKQLGEDSINRPVCVANLGRVYQQLGQNADALRCHREALEIYESQKDESGTAGQLANIASVLQDLGELDEALKHLQRAASLDEKAGNEAALAADLNNLGILCQRLERYDEAFQHHQRALDIQRRLNNDVGAANQLANMAAIHRKRRDLGAARDCYQEAWRLDNRTQSTLAEIADLCNLGLIFDELGEMDKAVTCYQQAIGLDRSVADREAEAVHLRTLAAMHRKLGQPAEAVRFLQQAIDIDRSIGNPKGEVASLIALGNAHRATGETTTARDLLERAVALATNLGGDAEAQARHALENVGEQPGHEAAGEEPERAMEAVAVQREPDGGSLWDNLQLLDDVTSEDAIEIDGSSPDDTTSADRDLIATLERQRDDAVRRVGELEAELEKCKQILRNLRAIVGQAGHTD